MKRILSGVQPSGKLHIGNYFGAVRQYVELQEGNDASYFIADYHALTSVQEPAAPCARTASLRSHGWRHGWSLAGLTAVEPRGRAQLAAWGSRGAAGRSRASPRSSNAR